MVRVSWKRIGGRKYAYLAHSIRLPDGTVTTITKRLEEGDERKGSGALARKYSAFLSEKEKDMAGKWATKHYNGSYIFSSEEMRKIEAAGVGYARLLKKLDKARKKDILDRFTANFTYDSNAIEGNSLTLKDVAIVMFEKETVPGKPLREIYETRNSRAVVELIMRRKLGITQKDIIRMHRILMRDIDTRTGYKRIPNVIFRAEREVPTTPPEDVEKEMGKLIEWYNNSGLHPLEKAAIFHGRFEKIHPFEDGNGRVGRFLINVILVNSGYPPLIIRKTSRRAYMSALTAFDNGHEDKLKRLMLRHFKDTFRKFFEIYIRYAEPAK
ncbi:MAG: Fic family protein [Candidatus Aenigmarchaeota archaeon]|nr:Fic family protein [Candidatus Aenigmarchaeota archaeon]